MVYLLYFTTALAAVLVAFYFYLKNTYTYWEKLGVPVVKPKFGLGNIRTDVHIAVWIKDIYDKLKGKSPISGMYFLFKPVALVTDLDLIRNIFIKDFSHFVNHGMYYNEKADPVSAHLFSLEDEKWKTLRQKLTPTFTSGKMKFMFPTVLEVADKLRGALTKFSDTDGRCDLKETLNRFTTDVISTCAFGLEVNCLEDPDSEFRKHGAASVRLASPLKNLFLDRYPKIAKFLSLRVFPKEDTEYFVNIVFDTIRYRLKNNVERSDFLQLLLKIREKDAMDGKETILTDSVLAAQAFLFFAAGFETSALASSFALYHMALDQNLQDKVRREMNEVLDKYNGEFTYEAMLEMTCLDKIFNESLRMYPPVPNLLRVCNNNYKVPGTDIVIKTGTQVFVPTLAIHRDPEYYPNPDVFNPENFSPENVEKRHPMSFLPFGDGPRACIGLRFAQMQGRIGLLTMLKHFRLSACLDTPKSIDDFDMEGAGIISKLPLLVQIEKL